MVIETGGRSSLQCVRIDTPQIEGSIRLQDKSALWCANLDSIFVLEPGLRRLTRHPFTNFRKANFIALDKPPRFPQLAAGCASGDTPLWLHTDGFLHAFNPKTLSSAGIRIVEPDGKFRQLPALAPALPAISPDGGVLAGTSTLGLLVGRTLYSMKPPSSSVMNGLRLAPTGIHFTKKGHLRSLSEHLPAEPHISTFSGSSISNGLWWRGVQGSPEQLQIRSGEADRVILELKSPGGHWNDAFITPAFKRLVRVDRRENVLSIHEFDLTKIDQKLQTPERIEIAGSLIAESGRRFTVEILTSGNPDQLHLMGGPGEAQIRDRTLVWNPPDVSKPTQIVFSVALTSGAAIQTFPVLVVPNRFQPRE